MDEAVLRAKRRMRIGADPDYDLLYENFDVLHYLLQSPSLLDHPEVDLIEHFLEKGRVEGLNPHPDFSMTRYLARYPHTAARRKVRNPYLFWLKHGRAAGEIADPAPRIDRIAPVLGMSPPQVADLVAERRRDLQQRFRTGRLGEVFARAAEIEPLIAATWTKIASPNLVPLSRPLVVDELCTIYESHAAAGFRRARVVIVADRVRRAGGRRMEGHLAHALAARIDPDEIVVIYTDQSLQDAPGSRFPDRVRQIDFARLAGRMPDDRAQHALVMLLRTLQADAIVNVNSGLLHQTMRIHARALAVSERMFVCFAGNEQTAMGTWEGSSLSYFYRTFEHVAGVITDSEHLAHELVETYRVVDKDRARIHVLRPPVDAALPVVSGSPDGPGRRPQVFSAGGWDRPGRIGLLLEVARRMPDIDFRIWGESVPSSPLPQEAPDNVRLAGSYEHISALPLAAANAWLYSSGSDGVPGQLLDIAMTGIPIVGSLVGGTDEVLSEEDAWPVAEGAGAEAFAAAIRTVLADPSGARGRARALRERMLRERTERAFASHAADLLLTDDGSREGGR